MEARNTLAMMYTNLEIQIEISYQFLLLNPSRTAGWPTLNLKSVFAALNPRVIRQFLHELSEAHIVFALIQSYQALCRSIRSSDSTPPEDNYSDAIGLTYAARKHLVELWIVCLTHGTETKLLRAGSGPEKFLVLNPSHSGYAEFIADHDFVERAQEWQQGDMIHMPVPKQDGELEEIDPELLDPHGRSFFQPIDERSARSFRNEISNHSTVVEVISTSGDHYGCVECGDVPFLRMLPGPDVLRRKGHRLDRAFNGMQEGESAKHDVIIGSES